MGGGKGKDGKGKDGKGKDGKGKGKSSGKGHLLERTRITAEPFSGTVEEWKGKFGWLRAAETIEHEKAGANGGRIFAGFTELVGVETLEAGQNVSFHLYEDAKGL